MKTASRALLSPRVTASTVSELDALVLEIRSGNRRALAKGLRLIESRRTDYRREAEALLALLLPFTGGALRLGISGAPGVGKSTFIEALGLMLVKEGHRVAVLAVDPLNSKSTTPVASDKTRMVELSRHPGAFVRSRPSSGTLNEAAARTRAAMLACEASGFDIVIIETVSVGQSEVTVAAMTDVFGLLEVPTVGDESQSIKRSIVELADVLAINKVDLNPDAAELAVGEMNAALELLHPAAGAWRRPVLGVSAMRGVGIQAFWAEVVRCRDTRVASGELEAKRRRKARDWMWALIDAALRERFCSHRGVRSALQRYATQVETATLTPTAAAMQLIDVFEGATDRG